MRNDVGRTRVRVPLLAAVCALAVTAVGAGTASANHWHSAGNCSTATEHGITHGSSTSDGSWFGRVAPANCGYYKQCAATEARWGNTTGIKESWGVSTLCSAWFNSTNGALESRCAMGAAYSRSSGGTTIISSHFHYSHYFNQTTCNQLQNS